ncbi:MGMT family protein [Gracilimonas mengyeensis]|uniref:Methylated-DNA-protein-cysteine methyltransferase related protein n=1 Tax=Gracilimonas mengyeensis TaxID=1302730 RepID=A0A521ARQ6_9BACT|nr:MGMT family protein [Gracilimonas mengyeensis]SMO37492.1 methylated-DNA-protein-cysteine methyltransferase related protein [Gracilimonas mengyeensis]
MSSSAKPNDFYERVFEVVAQIPTGRVTSYGAIAQYLGVASGARMVGYAMNNYRSYNLGYELPAHRVLNRLGQLTGRAHFEGDTMRERLQQEEVEFVDEYQVNMEKHFWDPVELEG